MLFVACRLPAPGVMVMLNAEDGTIISTLPLAGSSDGAVFNPATMEAFSSTGQLDGTLTIVKELSPTRFEVEQNLPTMSGAKTLTFDSKTNHILLIGAEVRGTCGGADAPARPADAAPVGRWCPIRFRLSSSASRSRSATPQRNTFAESAVHTRHTAASAATSPMCADHASPFQMPWSSETA